MAGWKEGGIEALIGINRSGKTTRALERIRKRQAKDGYPLAVLDLEESTSFMDQPHASCVDEVCYDLWILNKEKPARKSPRVWTPETKEARDLFFQRLAKWGGAHVLIDGLGVIADANHVDQGFIKAAIKWGHGKYGPTWLYVVGQQPQSLNYKLRFALVRALLFRLAKGSDGEFAAKMFGVDYFKLTNCEDDLKGNPNAPILKRGEYVEIPLGFQG